MLSNFKKKLTHLESEIGTENSADTPEVRRIIRAFLRWKWERAGELYERPYKPTGTYGGVGVEAPIVLRMSAHTGASQGLTLT